MEKEDEINWKIAHTSAQDMHLGEVNLAYRLGWGNWSSLTAWAAAHISTLYLRTTTVISGRLDGGLYYVSQQMDWRHAVNERKIERAHALRSLRTLSLCTSFLRRRIMILLNYDMWLWPPYFIILLIISIIIISPRVECWSSWHWLIQWSAERDLLK